MTEDDNPQRLDAIVAALPEIGSRSKARRAIESGKVRVDGVEMGPSDIGRKLAPGAQVVLNMSRPGSGPEHVKARRSVLDAGLRILFEDEHIVAIDKPAGLLTDTATAEQRRERNSARAALERYLKPKGFHALVVHRIDRDTSGVVLFAKTRAVEEALRSQFEARQPERVYWAALQGAITPEQGRWAHWMRWDSGKRIQLACEPGAEGGVLAESNYRVIHVTPRASIVEVRLTTGRRNQIRLQASLCGHPLLGERLYDRSGALPAGVHLGRQALHAARLTIEHPITYAPMTFTAPLPPDLEALDRTLRRPYEASKGDSHGPRRTARRPNPPRRP